MPLQPAMNFAQRETQPKKAPGMQGSRFPVKVSRKKEQYNNLRPCRRAGGPVAVNAPDVTKGTCCWMVQVICVTAGQCFQRSLWYQQTKVGADYNPKGSPGAPWYIDAHV